MDGDLATLVARMESDLVRLRAEDDPRRHFHATYLRTTRAVAAEINRGGFDDNPWLVRWDVAFAQLYLDALDADDQGGPVAAPWRCAFDAARHRNDLPPLRHVLLGMNAHINYDLPQALLAVIGVDEFADAGVLRRREADHRHIDEVLLHQVGAEDRELTRSTAVSLTNRVLRPMNRAATRRLLVESRRKVWHNTGALDAARRTGPARYVEVLADLEARCAAKLVELTTPGQVLLKLAVQGFGVRLP